MYPTLAASVGEMQDSAASEPPPIEIEVAALIKKAGQSLRCGLPSAPSEMIQADQKPPADGTVKAAAEPQGWDLRMSYPERILDPSRNAKTSWAAFLSGALLGTLLTGAICAWVLNGGSSIRLEQEDYSKSQIIKADKDNYGVSITPSKPTPAPVSTRPTTSFTPIPPTHRLDAAQTGSKRSAEPQKSVGTSKSTGASSGRALNPAIRPVSFRETRPTTIEGW